MEVLCIFYDALDLGMVHWPYGERKYGVGRAWTRHKETTGSPLIPGGFMELMELDKNITGRLSP